MSLNLLFLLACPEPPEAVDTGSAYAEGYAAGKAEAEGALQTQLDALAARLDAIEAADYATTADLAGYATTADLEGYATTEQLAGLVSAEDLEAYATDDDVAAEGVARADADAALDARLSVVEADYVASATLADALSAYTLYADAVLLADAAQSAAEVNAYAYADSLAAEAASRLDAIEADYLVAADLDDTVELIRVDTTWTIDQYGTGDFADVSDAIAALDEYRIAHDATLTIQLDAGAYYFTEALTFHHPDGGRIRLLGDESNVNLYFTGSHGIVVDEASSLGYVAGLALHGDASAANGLFITEASSAQAGALEIHDFGGQGVSVTGSSYLEGNGTSTPGWLSIDGSGVSGIYVADSSAAVLGAFEVSGSGNYGALAEGASYIHGVGASASANGDYGFEAWNGSAADFRDATSSDNSTGYLVGLGSSAKLGGATATGNSNNGFWSLQGSYVDAYLSGCCASSIDSPTGFEADGLAGFSLLSPSVSGSTTYAYHTYAHSYMYVSGAAGDTTSGTGQNDITGDFIYGL